MSPDDEASEDDVDEREEEEETANESECSDRESRVRSPVAAIAEENARAPGGRGGELAECCL